MEKQNIYHNSLAGEKKMSGEKVMVGQGSFSKEQPEKKMEKTGKESDNSNINEKRGNFSLNKKEGRGGQRFEKKPLHQRLEVEKLETKKVVKVTKGGRKFSFTTLILAAKVDKEEKAIAFAYEGGKEAIVSFRKSLQKAQKKLITYFPSQPRTISRDILINYKSTKIFLKPTPPGSGIRAGGILNKLFKFLGIKDISAKIIGSRRNKLNVVRAAFMALDKLTGKKYDY
jgi:small subunit ribosomal protein S5